MAGYSRILTVLKLCGYVDKIGNHCSQARQKITQKYNFRYEHLEIWVIIRYIKCVHIDINSFRSTVHVNLDENESQYVNNSQQWPNKLRQIMQKDTRLLFHHLASSVQLRCRETIALGRCCTTIYGTTTVKTAQHFQVTSCNRERVPGCAITEYRRQAKEI